MSVREIDRCRSCGLSDLEEVLNLGEHYLADFVVDGDPIRKAPLELVQCRGCGLVQLKHTVPREWLYRHYWFKSSVNEQMVAALRDVVDDAISRIVLKPSDVVVDIGANDGTLLRMYRDRIYRAGFEPAENLRTAALVGGNHILTEFFPPVNLWHVLVPKQPKIITAVAVFYDLDDPNGFVAAVKDWLHPDGVFVIQQAYAPSMVATGDIGNISHEHLEYYDVRSLAVLLNRHGLKIDRVSFNEVNGGSFRVIVRHGAGGITEDVAPPIDWAEFAVRAAANKERCLALLRSVESVAGYGASIRGNTILQYYGIGSDLVPYIAERNPEKWGKKTAGTGIPIVSEEEMRRRQPDYLFILPWHLLESFRRREPEYVGRMIVPLPEARIE